MSETTSRPERRLQPRVSVNLPLRLTIDNRTVETRIRDLSSSGIRFRAPAALPLLSRVQIALELPSGGGSAGGTPLAITGVVVRCDEAGAREANSAAGPFDTAIYFEDLSEGARAQLSQFVSAYLP